jgi:lipoate-protein ligase A
MKPPVRFVYLGAEAPPDHLQASPALAETVARTVARTGQSAVVLRHQSAYILLGPQDRRLPQLKTAVAWLEQQGFKVYMRLGGGSVVLLDEHCLSFAVIRPSRDFTQWAQNFQEMARPILAGLRALGIAAEFGRAEGSYCEGPYDIVAHGQKIAGVAQTIRGGYAMVSGMLLLNQDPVATTHLLQQFYLRAGSERRLNPRAVTALVRLVGQSRLTFAQLEAALREGFSQQYDLNPAPLTETEWELARALAEARRITSAALSA